MIYFIRKAVQQLFDGFGDSVNFEVASKQVQLKRAVDILQVELECK